jgi:uncharacterized protein (TIGR03067 family)
MKRSVLTLLLATGLLAAADTPKDDAGKKDLDKLKGTWQVVAMTIGGESGDKTLVQKMKLTIEGDRFTLEDGRGKKTATVKLDPSKKPPAFDLMPTGEKLVVLGIYELDGDALKLCWQGDEKKDRPTKFVSEKGGRVMLMELKREKKK